jgi:hypothetical protein
MDKMDILKGENARMKIGLSGLPFVRFAAASRDLERV